MNSAPDMLTLPYPPSTNRIWRNAKGHTFTCKQAEEWKKAAGWSAKAFGMRVTSALVAVVIELLPKMNKNGQPNKQRIDLDNCIKPALDALNGVAWVDDQQVIQITARVAEPVLGGGLRIAVMELGEA